MELSEEEKDVLFDIDMQLYNEFNDIICEMNENLGNIYSYKDLEIIINAEKEKEIKLLREAIKKQQDIIKNAIYIINNNKEEKIDAEWLYNFDKCTEVKEKI